MNTQTLPYLIPYFISLAILVGVGLYAWQLRSRRGTLAYAVVTLGQALWTAGYVFELVSTDLGSKLWWDNFQWLGAMIVPGAALVFAFRYRRIPMPYQRVLLPILTTVPFVAVLLAYTNEFHHLVAINPHIIQTDAVFGELTYTYGPASWVLIAYTYALIIPAIGVLIAGLLHAPRPHYAQLILAIVGLLLPVAGSMLATFSIRLDGHRDIAPLTFPIGSLLIGWALIRFRHLDIVPIARDKVIENMQEAVIVVDLQNRIIDANPAALAVRKRSLSDMVGRPAEEVYSDWMSLVERFRDLMEARVTLDFVIDGETRWFEMVISPLYDEGHTLLGRLLVVRDITVQEQAAQWLRDSQAQLEKVVQQRTAELRETNEALRREIAERQTVEQALRLAQFTLDHASEAVIWVGSDGTLIYANDSAAQSAHLTRAEMVGRKVWEVNRDVTKDAWPARWEAIKQKGTDIVEVSVTGRAGQTNYLEAILTYMVFDDREMYVSYGRDITERRKIEEALRQSERGYRSMYAMAERQAQELTLLEDVRMALARQLDLPALIRTIVTSITETFGYTQVSIYLMQGGSLVLQGHSGYQKIIERIPITSGISGRVARTGKPVLVESVHSDPDFLEAVPGIVSEVCVPLTHDGKVVGVLNVESIQGVKLTEADLHLMVALSQNIEAAIERASLVDNLRQELAERKRVEAELGLHRDHLGELVEQRTRLLEEANRHLVALSKVKDEFVANVSHELRTPITNIKLYLHLLSVSRDNREEYLATLRRESLRLETLIENLLLLSRLDQDRINMTIEPVDLNILSTEYVADRERMAEVRKLRLTLDMAGDLPEVSGSRELLGQALSILLTNALNYTPPGGSVEVSTRTRRLDGQTWAGIVVADTGPGFDLAEMPRLFTRFFRGKVGSGSGVAGTGLGLAIAHEIVDRHHGRITAENQPGPATGAIFEIWLPAGG